MGIDLNKLPDSIRNSEVFTDEQLGQLAAANEIPMIDPAFYDDQLKNIFQYYSMNPEEMEKELHCYAKELLETGKVDAAWQVLLSLS